MRALPILLASLLTLLTPAANAAAGKARVATAVPAPVARTVKPMAAKAVAPPVMSQTRYADDEIRVPEPAGWKVQDALRGVPTVRVVLEKPRGRGLPTVITVAVNPNAKTVDPAVYLKNVLSPLLQAPINYKLAESGKFSWKSHTGFRVSYTDPKGAAHFGHAAFVMPNGKMLDVAVQSPSADAWREDVAAYKAVLEGLELRGDKR